MSQNPDNTEVTVANSDTEETTHPSWLAFFTGLNTAIAVSYLICKPPQVHTLSWVVRISASVLYILITCLAGAAGTWITLSNGKRGQFRTLALWQARGWMFLPAIMVFIRERSISAPLIAASSAALMALYLFRLTEATPAADEIPRSQLYLEKDLFSTQIRLAPSSWTSLRLALLVYLALLSAAARELELLTIFFSVISFILVLEIARGEPKKEQKQNENAVPNSNPYSLIAAALCCLVIALSVPAAGWHDPFHGWGQVAPTQTPPKQKSSPDRSSTGYRTIVLWPLQKREKNIPSPPATNTASSPGLAKPWTIPFYGPYWYFKSVGESPGPNARTTRGDPLKVNVHSTDNGPLLMEAHQDLLEPIDLTCCSEIQVVFKNDPVQGALQLGLSFTDSHSPNKTSPILGIKRVALDDTEQHLESKSPIEQTLSFPFPKTAQIKRFDRITVMLLPDAKHRTIGRKVAIERFIMISK
jgi:hypothetical protein